MRKLMSLLSTKANLFYQYPKIKSGTWKWPLHVSFITWLRLFRKGLSLKNTSCKKTAALLPRSNKTSSSDKHAGGLLPSDCGKYVKILSEPINDLGPAYIVAPILALFEMFLHWSDHFYWVKKYEKLYCSTSWLLFGSSWWLIKMLRLWMPHWLSFIWMPEF